MWVLSAAAAFLLLLQVGYIVWRLIGAGAARRNASASAAGQGDSSVPSSPPQRSFGKLVAALLLALAAVGIALFGMAVDLAQRDKYEVGWLIALPAAGAVAAIALLLTMFSLPKGARTGAAEPLAWLLALAVLGIGACYGTMML
jgi:ABC-type polysaccharide/polyol phosphate export permease